MNIVKEKREIWHNIKVSEGTRGLSAPTVSRKLDKNRYRRGHKRPLREEKDRKGMEYVRQIMNMTWIRIAYENLKELIYEKRSSSLRQTDRLIEEKGLLCIYIVIKFKWHEYIDTCI